ncbi:REP-associated tyrosine transposase [Desulfotomaculum sp. 1211_IL3151]|uniref:REP-associated tyrosine transposase n=1 Tax=Desulfotomaculum sp. 1211_IL3151 TaxID=3084055 RepID=UPI002FD91184
MPRRAREKSETGIYHIMIRGANRQEIFHDDEDRLRFLETLGRIKITSEVKVYGWCLMNNHVHLLLEEANEDISITMKRLGVSFVWYYNQKYKTTGHLFQDRFKSENVESDKYLLTIIRYIHQNPVKAHLVKRVEQWRWSSCPGYYGGKVYPENLLDNDVILKMFSKDANEAREKFKQFNEQESNDSCLDDIINEKVKLSDEEARLEILKVIDGIEIAQVKSFPKKERDRVLQKIKGIEKITQRQAARILGVSPNLIFKA